MKVEKSSRYRSCPTCNGSGRIGITTLFGNAMVCPACKGAGEFEVAIPPEKILTCKYCNGNGKLMPTDLFFGNKPKLCPVCRGRGFIERPTIGTQLDGKYDGKNEVRISHGSSRLSHYDFDIAVSFAGEDREVVENYSNLLSSYGLKVFYDKYEQAGLWGVNLYEKLDEIYRKKALCCVLFISKYYAAKVWTNHERSSAQARALGENREYVLPVRLDDTEIPGISPTIGYIDLRRMSVKNLAEITIQKVDNLKHIRQ